MNIIKNRLILIAVAAVSLAMAGCSSELTNSAAPVQLIVTNTQTLTHLDIDPLTTDTDCALPIGTINMQVIAKPGGTGGEFTQVRVRRYRVSYRRTDGGTVVPAPFVRSIDTLIGVGQTVGSNFTVIEADALTQAPFAALRPQNGNRDPETGRPVVKLEVVLEVFGDTLAGDNVSDSTAFPLEFCYACGGCA
jgi:outer membrane murein-binding lipoprotein Lpp